jgi:hypothetical protein
MEALNRTIIICACLVHSNPAGFWAYKSLSVNGTTTLPSLSAVAAGCDLEGSLNADSDYLDSHRLLGTP